MPGIRSSFVHLHVHTQYSLLDGAIGIDPLIAQAQAFGMEAVSITDHGTMFGVMTLYTKAKKAGLRPVLGCEVYVAPRTINDKTPEDAKGLTHLVLIAENQEGYRNLCRLVSIAQMEGFYYRPRIDKQLLEAHHEGLIALSACLRGEIPMHIKNGHIDQADAAARWYQALFGENRFYLEVQNNGIDIQETVNRTLWDMSQRLSIPLVASNDCHYLHKEDVRAHDVLLCIQTGKTVNETNRFRFSTDQLYFKSPEEMAASFADYPGAVSNTLDIARRCAYEFDFSYHFPKFQAPEDIPPEDLFEHTVREGFRGRMAKILEKQADLDQSVYNERLDYEISVIKEMGFSGYFLIVADFIRYAKDNGIPVGPGRGSAAGSMVAYAMGITDLDPIEHGLIFERFLNPARISMPDIDVDFCINGRDQVYKYVVDKYGGGDYVAQIITFGNLKARAVIRDVGRALGISLREVDAIAKMVPDVLNISLDDAILHEPKFNELAATRPEIKELLQICRVLEGLPRHASTHAAGAVIGDKPLTEYLPLYRGKKGEVVTQFDMKHVEKTGLVKFDFLGLRNLTVIAKTLSLLADQGKPIPDMADLDLDDRETYNLLCNGDTTGVFQLESTGMKELVVRLKPASFEDITALLALYRPGPLDSGMVDDFVECKRGRKPVVYSVPQLEPILKETYGVILYQEQVMKIAAELANYSMDRADDLRKAMGKKIAEKMAEHRDSFMAGAQENQIPEDKAKRIFDLMEKFGGYGFNKSHSAAYALIAYQTAYLKAHYPVEFLAALLTSEMHSTDGVVKYMAECRSHEIPVLPPDVNFSGEQFSIDDGAIRYGLTAIRHVGEPAVQNILKAREDAPFRTLTDFRKRTDSRLVNKRVIESLVKSGAFDSTGFSRQVLLSELSKTNDSVKVSDFMQAEKEALGFYLSDHPNRALQGIIKTMGCTGSKEFALARDRATVRFIGNVQAVKDIKTKTGKNMCFITLEDALGTIEAVMFMPSYYLFRPKLSLSETLYFSGAVEHRNGRNQMVVRTVKTIDEAVSDIAQSLHVFIDQKEGLVQSSAEELIKVLEEHPGAVKVFLHDDNGGDNCSQNIALLVDDLRVDVGEKLKSDLLEIPAVKSVDVVFG